MSFYTYNQNNSGGSFTGPAKYVVIEASSANVANAIAEDHGLYFDGCETGEDCSCCGDRWYRPYSYDIKDRPTIYGDTIEEFLEGRNNPHDRLDGIPFVMVVYLNGTVDKFDAAGNKIAGSIQSSTPG